jgi:hypothetical protein
LLNGNIMTLCAFSHLSHIFDRELEVNFISAEPRRLSYPRSQTEWQDYISTVFDIAALEKNHLIEEEARLAWKAPAAQTDGLVHCECLLLAYHHHRIHAISSDHTPPLNYIGCSKLSCYACGQYFSAYNASSIDRPYPTHFFIRGSQSKLDPRWAMPDLRDHEAEAYMRTTFLNRLCDDYARYLVAMKRGRRRAGLDSTIGNLRS